MYMKYDFNAQLEKVGEENNIGGSDDSFYRIEEGNSNLVRIMTPAEVIIYYFQGKGVKPVVAYGYENGDPRKQGTDEFKPSARFMMYVIDRSDGKIKLAEFPYTVQKAIGELQKNPDYSFDEVPMPYDIRISYNKSESPANMYRVTASPKQVPVTADEMKALDEKMAKATPEEYVRKKKDFQKKSDQEAGIWKSPEQVKKQMNDFAEKAMADQKVLQDADVPTISYPDDEGLTAKDIPF